MLFEAATGRLPFYGDSPYQLMRQHVDVEAPRARSLVPDLPAAIDDAIARALAKDPLDRFATAEDLARALADDSPARDTAMVPARRACERCGGWMVDAAAVCADCGKALLRLELESEGGVSVLVTGPGEMADKLDARRQVALYKLLDELPPAPSRSRAGTAAHPAFPSTSPRGSRACRPLRWWIGLWGIGFDACIAQDWPLARQAIRSKVWQTTYRPLAAYGL